MRLGQLARKLAIPPSEISDFLISQGMPSIEGSNTRLSSDQLTVVLQRFAPGELSVENLQNDEAPEADEVLEAVPAVASHVSPDPEVPENIASSPVESEREIVSAVEPEKLDDATEGKVETIKAQKVALSGLKVLGRIELPEPKKKTVEPAGETASESSEPAPQENNRPPYEKKRPHQFKKERREQRPAKNPIALAREREAQAAEEKRREDEKRKKEHRTLNYQKRIKTAAPTKAARLVDEDVVKISDVDLKPAPKTWFGKFWRWFTT